jgi:hemerythrin
MTPVAWTPALAVGHPEIDAQHQELFRRVARLLEAMLSGDCTEVGPLFEFLGSYVVDHFAAEEVLMRESGFPGYNVHRAVHERFVRDFEALRQLHVTSGANAAVAIKAQTWLVQWLKNHIASIDQQLGRHLLQRVG